MRQSLRLVLKVKPFKIFTAIHTIHFLICSEGRDFIIEPFFECLRTTCHKYFFLIYDTKINYLEKADKKAIECLRKKKYFLFWKYKIGTFGCSLYIFGKPEKNGFLFM